MRLVLEIIGERLELGRFPVPMLEGTREEPIREPRIPRQQRPVEVRADRRPDARTLQAAFAVVPEPGYDTSDRLRTRVEPRHPGMILEPGQRLMHARLELAVQQTVSDHPSLARNRLVREQAHSRQLHAVPSAIEPSQQLIAAAHRKNRCPAGDRLADCIAPRRQVGSNQRLLTILATSDVQKIMLPRAELVAEGKSLLFYSSETEEMARLCHRVLVMREGRIAAELAGEATDAEAIVAASLREHAA